MVASRRRVPRGIKSAFSCFRAQESKKVEDPSQPSPPPPSSPRTALILGDRECGKTSLVARMTTGHFVRTGCPVPKMCDSGGVVDVSNGQEHMQLSIHDTTGQEDNDHPSPIHHHDADVIILCFSLADPVTLNNAQDTWFTEARHHSSKAPIILVGNKKDLRDIQSSSNSSSGSSEGSVSGSEETNASYKNRLSDFYKSTSSMESSGASVSRLKETDGHKIDAKSSRASGRMAPENSKRLITLSDDIVCESTCEKVSSELENSCRSFTLPYEQMEEITECPVFNAHAPVKHREGAQVAQRINAHAYFETSALNGENVKELLQAICKAAALGRRKSKRFRVFSETLKSWRSLGHLAK